MGDTQPLEGGSSQDTEGGGEGGVWGWLVTLWPHTHPTLWALRGDRVRVGRVPGEGNIAIQETSAQGNSRGDYLKISRIHFEVYCERGGKVGLVDKSANGTFVNQLRVGKESVYSLSHCDVISLLEPGFSLYYFLHEEQMKKLYPANLVSQYLVGRTLGSGATATVREAFTREGHTRRAVKAVRKEGEETEHLMREVEVVKGIQHPCVTQIVEVLDSPDTLMIVMEYAGGGELFGQLVRDYQEGSLVEQNAKIQFFQIAHTIAFLHCRKISHRDLKLENILLMEPGPTSRIKVTDFGLSKKWSSTNPLETFVG